MGWMKSEWAFLQYDNLSFLALPLVNHTVILRFVVIKSLHSTAPLITKAKQSDFYTSSILCYLMWIGIVWMIVWAIFFFFFFCGGGGGDPAGYFPGKPLPIPSIVAPVFHCKHHITSPSMKFLWFTALLRLDYFITWCIMLEIVATERFFLFFNENVLVITF